MLPSCERDGNGVFARDEMDYHTVERALQGVDHPSFSRAPKGVYPRPQGSAFFAIDPKSASLRA